MSALAVADDLRLFDLAEREPVAFRSAGSPSTPFQLEGVEPRPRERPGGEPTLDDVIVRAWEGLTAHAVVACPACGDEMAPRYGAHARPVAGCCRSCGATLS